MKTVDELAREVLAGKWGTGDDRKRKLQAAGYDYDVVQKRVNVLVAIENRYWIQGVTQGATGKFDNHGVTIGQGGCGLCSITCCIVHLNEDLNVTPDVVATKIRNKYGDAFKAGLWYRVYGIVSEYGLVNSAMKETTLDYCRNLLQSGSVFCAGNSGNAQFVKPNGKTRAHVNGHEIMFYKYENGIYYAKDSAKDGGICKYSTAQMKAFMSTASSLRVISKKTAPKKTNEEIAFEVLDRKWSSGDERKRLLTAAGYDYDAIQSLVNTICQYEETVVQDVLNRKYGNGDERIAKLKKAGYDPAFVQRIINEYLRRQEQELIDSCPESDSWFTDETDYVTLMTKKVSRYGSNTDFAATVDTDRCRATFFKYTDGAWRALFGVNSFQGNHTKWSDYEHNGVYHQAKANYQGPRSRSFKGAWRVVGRWRRANGGNWDNCTVCYVPCDHDKGATGGDNCQRFERTGYGNPSKIELQKRFRTLGCCALADPPAYWVFDHFPDNSTVIVFDEVNPYPSWSQWDARERPANMSVDALALQVLAGAWGTGDTRKRNLQDAGYDYDAVQKRVNQLVR